MGCENPEEPSGLKNRHFQGDLRSEGHGLEVKTPGQLQGGISDLHSDVS